MSPQTTISSTDHGDPFDELGAAYGRRRLFAVLGGGALAAVASGAVLGRWSSVAASTLPDGSLTPLATTVIPEETAGPFPGDGSNGPNVLDDAGVVRQDITASYGDSTTVAGGIPLTIELVLSDVVAGAAYEGAAVYAWHCDREGRYSLYSEGVEAENYLRGVQPVDAEGVVSFRSIFPGCYDGRWPHVHFEVYPTLDDAVAGTNRLATSQLAFPQVDCEAVYATEGYDDSVGNLSRLSLETDGVFRDDAAASQLATMSGDVAAGYTARLAVGV